MRKMAVLVCLMLFGAGAASAAEGCKINRLLGDVQVLREGQRMPVKEKDTLKKGDKVETGEDCRMDMSMNGLAGCRLLGKSSVEIMGWKLENMSLKVDSGNVLLSLRQLPKNSNFKVETPSAIASVRGTQFWGRVNWTPCPAGLACDMPTVATTTFAVREGSVEIHDKISSKTFTIQKGQALDIAQAATTPASVRQALPAEMLAMEQTSSISTA